MEARPVRGAHARALWSWRGVEHRALMNAGVGPTQQRRYSMKWVAAGVLLTVPVAVATTELPVATAGSTEAPEDEKAAVLEVIERQAAAFWAKDFQRWADTWVHAAYVRRLGWSEVGGVSSIEGWEAIGQGMKQNMADNPTPNRTAAKLVRDHINVRISGDVAWVTFEQHAASTGEARFDMPGLSYETRILERRDGKWKVAYLSYLLAGGPSGERKR